MSGGSRRPRAILLYHFYAPDPVVSARLFSALGEDWSRRGFDVEAWPCNRTRSGSTGALPARERIAGVLVRRVWRPAFAQGRSFGRIVNTVWMLLAWGLRSAAARGVDVVVLGTDPPMAGVVAWPWRLLHRRTRLVQWCFDVYPDAAVAHGWLRREGRAARWLSSLARASLHACDALVDIGPRMRARLAPAFRGRRATLPPWEPSVGGPERPSRSDSVRREMFGDAAVALLYAGHLGRAHDAAPLLDLARRTGKEGVVVAFQGIGLREGEVRRAATGLANVRFLPRCEPGVLGARLAAADAHLVSLAAGWSGIVVPSKFFAALAAGRPVLYFGPEDSDVAAWIRDADLGAVVSDDASLRSALARLKADRDWGRRCAVVARERFSREAALEGWATLLGELGVRLGERLARAGSARDTRPA